MPWQHKGKKMYRSTHFELHTKCRVMISFTLHPLHTRGGKKNTYNFYLVIEVPDHVYVFYAYRLYFSDKDIYMIRYFYHKIEIVRVFYY